jgi:hypothetical protein
MDPLSSRTERLERKTGEWIVRENRWCPDLFPGPIPSRCQRPRLGRQDIGAMEKGRFMSPGYGLDMEECIFPARRDGEGLVVLLNFLPGGLFTVDRVHPPGPQG